MVGFVVLQNFGLLNWGAKNYILSKKTLIWVKLGDAVRYYI